MRTADTTLLKAKDIRDSRRSIEGPQAIDRAVNGGGKRPLDADWSIRFSGRGRWAHLHIGGCPTLVLSVRLQVT
jgi:hypothetical protein